MKTKFRAIIYYDVYEDSYTEGEGTHVNCYDEEFSGDTLEMLLFDVASCLDCYIKDLYFDNINDYEWASEFWWSFMCDEDNYKVTPVSSPELFQDWKNGETKLYVTHCHILVSKVTETPLDLNEVKKLKVQIEGI